MVRVTLNGCLRLEVKQFDVGEVASEIDYQKSGDDLVIYFDVNYLMRIANKGTMSLGLAGANGPLLVKQDNFTGVVMPMDGHNW